MTTLNELLVSANELFRKSMNPEDVIAQLTTEYSQGESSGTTLANLHGRMMQLPGYWRKVGFKELLRRAAESDDVAGAQMFAYAYAKERSPIAAAEWIHDTATAVSFVNPGVEIALFDVSRNLLESQLHAVCGGSFRSQVGRMDRETMEAARQIVFALAGLLEGRSKAECSESPIGDRLLAASYHKDMIYLNSALGVDERYIGSDRKKIDSLCRGTVISPTIRP